MIIAKDYAKKSMFKITLIRHLCCGIIIVIWSLHYMESGVSC